MSYAFVYRRDFVLYGQPIIWLRSMGQCPCTNPLTNAYDRTHDLCQGTGFLREKVDVSQYLAVVHSANMRNRYDRKFGDLKEGDLFLSTYPQEIPWDEDDIIIVPNLQTTRTELIVRGTGAYDELSQPYALAIDRIFDATGPVSAAAYVLTNADQATAGQITWLTSIASGDTYSVRYRYSPRYTVVAGSILRRKPDLMGNTFPQSGLLRIMTLVATDGQ